MSASVPPPITRHLRAAAFALGWGVLIVLASIPVSDWAMQRRLLELIETPLSAKNQGERLQRAAFRQKDVLPVYGSSELSVVVRNRPDEYFHSNPDGFHVGPVGVAGNTSFLIAQKIAAVGDAARGKKIALILSATWFCRAGVPDDSYAGNFSALQAGSILFGSELDASLRERFVKRMLEFPGSLSSHRILGAYLRHAGSPGAWSAAARAVVRPLLWANQAELAWQDRIATLIAAAKLDGLKPHHAKPTGAPADISKLISRVESREAPGPGRELRTKDGEGDAAFVAGMNASKEWSDLVLLFDTLKHFKMQVLVLSVPLPAWHFDRHAVSRGAMDRFYERLESTCGAWGYPCFDFSDHEWDEGFTLPNTSHFSEKGWLYVDRVLDDFYHDRLSPPPPSGNAS